MTKKKLVPLLAAILIVLTLAAGVSALVFDQKNNDHNKGTISLITNLASLIRADDDDREDEDRKMEDQEVEKSEAEDNNPTAVDSASSASRKATGDSVSLDAGSGSGSTAPTGQPTVDAASSASIKSTVESISLDAGSGSGITTPTGQPTVDAASSASIKSPAMNSPAIVISPAADSGTSVPAATQPGVDVIASASLPKPGTTSPTTSNPTAPTTVNERLITEADARSIAIASVGVTAYVKEVEFEPNDYPPVYEIKLLFGGKEFKVEIHAVTGAILDVERDEDD